MSLSRVRWDGTINFGHVLTVITLIMTAAVVAHKAEMQFAAMDKRVTVLETLLSEYLPVIRSTKRRVDDIDPYGGNHR